MTTSPFPLVEPLWLKAAVIAAGYALTLALSGRLVRWFVLPRQVPLRPEKTPDQPRFEASTVIGKCENLLVLSFLLAGEVTGIALIFAAKSLVRSEDIRKKPGYYLGGTLVNLVWAVLVGILLRLAVVGPW
ncbi:MAG: hypothetical protein ISR76_00735 [Planctomycetes bacterium]|nr:hypothetical protein [Planctomycetota bacterium]MBL7007497.1 hypothetical protein [Planctomycetota bacterium]